MAARWYLLLRPRGFAFGYASLRRLYSSYDTLPLSPLFGPKKAAGRLRPFLEPGILLAVWNFDAARRARVTASFARPIWTEKIER
jgi:hypothetical protein